MSAGRQTGVSRDAERGMTKAQPKSDTQQVGEQQEVNLILVSLF